MPRSRGSAVAVVHRTARVELRVSSAQRERCFGLLRSAGDVWAVLLQANRWRRQSGAPALVGYQELCRELAAAGPGVFGELSSVAARSVLRRYSDAWFAAAARAKAGAARPGFPRRRRGLLPVRFYAGTFELDGCRLRLPVAAGRPPLWLRLTRSVPYPAGTVRSVTLLHHGDRLFLEVTAELPVTSYPDGQQPDPQRVAGVDLGIIHPYAGATGDAADLSAVTTTASTTTTTAAGAAAAVGRPGCWCRAGRCGPSTGCTWPTPRSGPGRSPAELPVAGSAARGGGRRLVLAAARSGPGTPDGSSRPSTRPPPLSFSGRCSAGSGR